MASSKNEKSFWWNISEKSLNTNVRPRNFIQNNSTLFRCFTLLKLLHRWTIFIFVHTKKSLSTERLLICPRDETGSLYITRVQEKRRGLQTVVVSSHQNSSNTLVTFWLNSDHTHLAAEPLTMTTAFLFIKITNLWNSNQWNDHISLAGRSVGRSLLVCMNSFHRHYKIPAKKAEILLFGVSGFFSFYFFFHRKLTN